MHTAPFPLIDYGDIEGETPLDFAVELADRRGWDYECFAGATSVSIAAEGEWHLVHSITVAWSENEDMIRIISSFPLECPTPQMPVLLHLLNCVNHNVDLGSFTFYEDPPNVVWRYALRVSDLANLNPEDIDILLQAAVLTSDRYLPAFREVAYNELDAKSALTFAIARPIGRA